jgi:hypothetical protein
LSGAAVAGVSAAGGAWASLPKGAVTEENLRRIDLPIAEFRLDRRTGDLVGLTWKDPRVEIIREPRLGENFRILLPLPDYEANYFNSSDQEVGHIEQSPDGVTLFYSSLQNAQGTLPVKVQYKIRMLESRLEFSIDIDNPTDFPLAEVYFALIGGQQGLKDRANTESLVPGLNSNLAPAIFTNFRPGSYGGGNLGIRYDAAGFTYPGAMQMGWIDFFDTKADLGLYYANHDPISRLSALYFELRPFTKTAAVGSNWPTTTDVSDGEPIGLTAGWMKFPYLRKGRFSSGPVALQVHRGDWHQGSELYRAWFDRHFQVKRMPTWLRKEMAWQSIIMLNPEDVIVHRFKDLPRLAADAKRYGVTTFEILGWDVGGIDRGYPQYTPDPRLGTHEEFRQALGDIRKLGVHPVIFANIQFADTSTKLFQERLHRFLVMGRWAPDNPAVGWGEGTHSSRMGLARRNMTLVSPAHPEYREFLISQFVQLAKDGAEALQLDKTNAASSLDFNPHLPTSPDQSLTEELLVTFRETLRRLREVNPEFALASEIFWDRAFPMVDVSYVRMNEIDMASPALRFTFPEWTSTIFAENPGDFNVMSNGMRYGLVWAMAPRHYNDSLDEPLTRPLSQYVRELIRIRTKHKALLFHGRFRDVLGAQIKAGKNMRYSCFERMDSTGNACVVVNYGNEEGTAEVTWPQSDGQEAEVLKPFHPDTTTRLPVNLSVAPRSCAVIVRA